MGFFFQKQKSFFPKKTSVSSEPASWPTVDPKLKAPRPLGILFEIDRLFCKSPGRPRCPFWSDETQAHLGWRTQPAPARSSVPRVALQPDGPGITTFARCECTSELPGPVRRCSRSVRPRPVPTDRCWFAWPQSADSNINIAYLKKHPKASCNTIIRASGFSHHSAKKIRQFKYRIKLGYWSSASSCLAFR